MAVKTSTETGPTTNMDLDNLMGNSGLVRYLFKSS